MSFFDNWASLWYSKKDIVSGQNSGGGWWSNPVDRNAHGGTIARIATSIPTRTLMMSCSASTPSMPKPSSKPIPPHWSADRWAITGRRSGIRRRTSCPVRTRAAVGGATRWPPTSTAARPRRALGPESDGRSHQQNRQRPDQHAQPRELPAGPDRPGLAVQRRESGRHRGATQHWGERQQRDRHFAGKFHHLLVIPPASLPVPKPVVAAVTNAASYATAVAPGQMVIVWGSGMGPTALARLALDSNGLVSNTVAGVRVLFDGVPAPIVYVSATQIAVVTPYFGTIISFQ